MDAADRGKLIFRLADLVEEHAEELALLESFNCGKTISDSKGDMVGVCNTLRYYVKPGRQDRRPHLYLSAAAFPPTRCGSRWAWLGRSSRGTSRC